MKITVIGLGYVGIVAASCLANRGHHVTGVDVDPERVMILRSGRLPIVVVGVEPGDTRSLDVVSGMNNGNDAPRIVTDITSAEMVKYASNAFLATRISFINEMAALCERVGASIDTVSQSLAMDPRTGSRIHAGVGYGGSCFPKDVRALDHLALISDANVDLLRSVITVNNRQRLRPLHALRERFNGGIGGLCVAVLGLAFKPDTDDVREAPALDLIRALIDDGASVSAYDPQAGNSARRHLPSSVALADDPAAATKGAHAVVLMTEWDQIVNAGWETIAQGMRPPRYLFDGRNVLDAALMERLGFEYRGVGRSADVNGHVRTGPRPVQGANGRHA
ncbi:MAG: nucleotide sugar dehydrogenase [Chloroflexota bacterium]|nr:nucleotide sugar dehydrogenase [Chloroflexota bacterium]MDE2960343.1 nucleotide sugar dehydrogenase [Chloroflexota bacterium]